MRRATAQGLTESDVVRSALAIALGKEQGMIERPPAINDDRPPPTVQVKLSVRIARHSAFRLDRQARAAGLSRGAYLGRLSTARLLWSRQPIEPPLAPR